MLLIDIFVQLVIKKVIDNINHKIDLYYKDCNYNIK